MEQNSFVGKILKCGERLVNEMAVVSQLHACSQLMEMKLVSFFYTRDVRRLSVYLLALLVACAECFPLMECYECRALASCEVSYEKCAF